MQKCICILLLCLLTACGDDADDTAKTVDAAADIAIPIPDNGPNTDIESADASEDIGLPRLDVTDPPQELVWEPVSLLTRETIHDIWGPGDTTFWAVGSAGTLIAYNGTTWLPSEHLTDSVLYGVSGLPGGDIWVVGANGTVLRRDTAGWNVLDAGVEVDLYDVHAVSPTEVYLVGDEGTIIKFNGTAFETDLSNTSANLRCVFGTPGGVLFAGGTGGQILKRSGGQWVTTPAGGGTETITGIWGTSTDFVVAVGTSGQIFTFSSNVWTPQTSNDIKQRDLYGVWGVSDKEVYLVGDEGVIIVFDGSKWTLAETEGPLYRSSDFRAIAGTTVGDDRVAFSAGVEGAILSYAGGLWADTPSGPNVATLSVAAFESGDFLAVGEVGLALIWNAANGWSGIETNTDADLHGVHTIGENAIAVGTNGKVLLVDDRQRVTPLDSGTSKPLESVHGTSDTLLAVGAAGAAFRLDALVNGENPTGTPEATGTVVTLHDVWVQTDGSAIAVGDSGTVVQRSIEGNWTATATPTSNNLHGVTVSENTIWIVGDHGLILRSEGTGFEKDNEAPGRFLYDIASSGTGAIAVGWTGLVLRRTDAGWVEEDSGTPNILEGLAESPNGTIWVVGHNGTVLRRK